jgi:hypothetical protein
MRRIGIILLLAAAVYVVSCSDDDNPATPNTEKPLFSVSLQDTNGDPVTQWAVGSVNHPINAGKTTGALKPCPETEISFTLPESSDWTLTIYDYNGDLVKTLSGFADAGELIVSWDGSDEDGQQVFNGFYRYHLTAGAYDDEKWMVLERLSDVFPIITVIGAVDSTGRFVTDNIALFPGLIAQQPIEYYTDTVTVQLADISGMIQTVYGFTMKLNRESNSLVFRMNENGIPQLESGP